MRPLAGTLASSILPGRPRAAARCPSSAGASLGRLAAGAGAGQRWGVHLRARAPRLRPGRRPPRCIILSAASRAISFASPGCSMAFHPHNDHSSCMTSPCLNQQASAPGPSRVHKARIFAQHASRQTRSLGSLSRVYIFSALPYNVQNQSISISSARPLPALVFSQNRLVQLVQRGQLPLVHEIELCARPASALLSWARRAHHRLTSFTKRKKCR